MSPDLLYRRYVASGDEADLILLFRAVTKPLLAQAHRLGHGHADAEDLLQETMIVATQGRDRFDAARPLLPWLRGILVRKSAQLLRARRTRQEKLDGRQLAPEWDGASSRSSPESHATARELRSLVGAAVDSLDPKYGVVLRHYLFEERRPKEIAEQLQMGASMVRVRLHRGLRQVRALLPAGLATTFLISRLRGGPVPSGASRVGAGPIKLTLGYLLFVSLVPSQPVDAQLERRVESVSSAKPTPGEAELAPERRRAIPIARVISTPPSRKLFRLHVRVATHDGHAIRDAGVMVWPEVGFDALLKRRRLVTPASGVVTFEDLPGPLLHVHTDRGGHRVVDLTREGNRLEMRFGRAIDRRGQVVDRDGRPVPGAAIWLGGEVERVPTGGLVCRTDSNGEFELRQVPRAALISVLHPSFTATTLRRAGDAVALRFVFTGPGQPVQGVVRNERDEAVAGARVLVGRGHDAAPAWLADGATPRLPPLQEMRTDERGFFETLGLPPGRHQIVVRSAGHAPLGTYVEVTESGARPIRLRLRPGGHLTGQVRDQDGEPLAGAHFVYRSAARHTSVDGRTDSMGRFLLDALPTGSGLVAVRVPGYSSRRARVKLAQGSSYHQDLVLHRLERWRGVVVDASDKPLPRIEIRCLSSVGAAPTYVRTDTGGMFSVPKPDGVLPQLSYRDAGSPLWQSTAGALARRDGRLILKMPATARASGFLVGTLSDHEGAPIRRARLYLSQDGGKLFEVGCSDAEGAYRLGPLVRGEYSLFAESSEGSQASGFVGSRFVAEGAEASLHYASGSTGRVRWDLRFSDGQPPTSPIVTIVSIDESGTGRRHCLRHRASGTQRLRPGRYRIFAMGEGFRWLHGREFKVEANQDTVVRVGLARAVRRVLELRGLPDPVGRGWRGDIRDSNGGLLGSYTLGDDTVLSAFLPKGDYAVRVEGADSRRSWRGSFSVSRLAPRFEPVAVELSASR